MFDDDDDDDEGPDIRAIAVPPEVLKRLFGDNFQALTADSAHGKLDLANYLMTVRQDIERSHLSLARSAGVMDRARADGLLSADDSIQYLEELRALMAAMLRLQARITLKLADAHAPEVG